MRKVIFRVMVLMMACSPFLFPDVFANFFNLVGATFFPRKEVIAEIPLGGGNTAPAMMRAEIAVSSEARQSIRYPKILISEVMAGTISSAQDEFIELYNPNERAVSLEGWSIKKRSGTGSESSFVSPARFKESSIPPYRYFLIAHEAGYANTAVLPDILWPKSYSLSSREGALVLYNPEGETADEANWDSIPKNQSVARVSWEEPVFSPLSIPTPQNSSR